MDSNSNKKGISDSKEDRFTRRERNVFLRKEILQKHMMLWFGLGLGLSVVLEFARAYYYLVTSRSMYPGMADPSHFELEYNSILGIAVGIIIAVLPIFIFQSVRTHPAVDFTAERVNDGLLWKKLTGVFALVFSFFVLWVGAFLAVRAQSYFNESGIGSMVFMMAFGSSFLAGPLMVEGLWILYAAKHGMKEIHVLRGDIWRAG